MADPYLGEMRMFAFDWAPRNWALCNGQLVAISANQPLYQVLGTTWGGDGVTTFGLPDLRSRTPVHIGTGHGLSTISLGQYSGVETVALKTKEMPPHNHTILATEENATVDGAGGNILAHTLNPANGEDFPFYNIETTKKAMNSGSLLNTGGGKAHTNMQPSLVISFCIALTGETPQRS